ncbi:MAG: hypothetical protein JW874_16335 [Spirochaetales bacterium]|nr:hypothetical protein [Spirochaetales bacterium]
MSTAFTDFPFDDDYEKHCSRFGKFRFKPDKSSITDLDFKGRVSLHHAIRTSAGNKNKAALLSVADRFATNQRIACLLDVPEHGDG